MYSAFDNNPVTIVRAASSRRRTSDAGRKHGVSLSRKWMSTPARSSRCRCSASYFSCVNDSLKAFRLAGIMILDDERALTHDLPFIGPDVKVQTDDVDMRPAEPIGARVRAVRIAESDVQAGKLFVLENIADHRVQLDVRANRKFPDAVAVLVRMRVRPEVALQTRVRRRCADEAIAFDRQRQRRRVEQSVPLAQPVADDAIDDKGAVHFERRREDLAARQVAPLLRADETAGLDPLVGRRQRGRQIAAASTRRPNVCGAGNNLEHATAQRIDLGEIRAHALPHDFRRDVHHVRMTNPPAVDDVGHCHSKRQLVRLRGRRKDTDLTALERLGHWCRHRRQRPRRQILEHERLDRGADVVDLLPQCVRDIAGVAIGNQRDVFVPLNIQAHANRVACAWLEIGLDPAVWSLKPVHNPAFVWSTMYRTTAFMSRPDASYTRSWRSAPVPSSSIWRIDSISRRHPNSSTTSSTNARYSRMSDRSGTSASR